jgi:hypothetical protein
MAVPLSDEAQEGKSPALVSCPNSAALKVAHPVSLQRYRNYTVCLGKCLEKPCKTTMKPFFPKQFLNPLILLVSIVSLGSAMPPNIGASAILYAARR